MKPLTVPLGAMLFLALSVPAATELQARTGIQSKSKPPDPLAQIQLGPPISPQMILDWRTRDGFQFQPLQPSGHNVNALQAVKAARDAYVGNPGVYVGAVRFGRIVLALAGWHIQGKLVWLVTFPDNQIPLSGSPGSSPGLQHTFTVVIVNAKTGKALVASSSGP